MLEIRKDASLEDCSIPFGVLEVRYPPRAEWRVDEWRELAAREIEGTRARFAAYERRSRLNIGLVNPGDYIRLEKICFLRADKLSAGLFIKICTHCTVCQQDMLF